MLSNIEIAQRTELLPIVDVAGKLGVRSDELELYGDFMAKIDHERVLQRVKDRPRGKFITVTGITPTPLGEGKTVTSIGLGQALVRLGLSACNTLREPSKGPNFGIKGSGCGGGYSQMLPMEKINLHFTGDIAAAEAAQNLCAAAIDSSIFFGNRLDIDPLSISWPRCVDVNDRALRRIVLSSGGKTESGSRNGNYVITAATEVAAIHSLAAGLADLRDRFGEAVIGFNNKGGSVTCENLKVAGAMTALLVDALKPNLVQSTENHPILCHGFPFANVAHGNNSILADLLALQLCDYVVSESGFGADCGFEKLMNVKVRQSSINVDCAVIVASIRALKQHGGAFHLRPGKSYETVRDAAEKENPGAVERGCQNLAAHIKIVKAFGVPAVVAINRFPADTERELNLACQAALAAGADAAVVHEAWGKGGAGAVDLARAVVKVVEKPVANKFIYAQGASIREKIEATATKVYGADGVVYAPPAREKIKKYSDLGYDGLCLNMVKTQFSLTHDPEMLGAPAGWTLPIQDIGLCAGAKFICPLTGNFLTMPGFPSSPSFASVDVDLSTGKIRGLF
ncbi:MAG: formate--tetrahydrofolate ligase [Dehalococcoidia bacterium]|nr:formate--tetrahydrofolate ligase [Dehalococcoidia bacterium]